MRGLLVIIASLLMGAQAATAAPAVDLASDAVLEARVNEVSAELRCMVCQNQSLADSHAELALDLKNQVREQLRAGRSADEVVAFMTERYGDFVRYRPALKASTLLLWLGPLLLLAAASFALWRRLRENTRPEEQEEVLSPERQAQAASLLAKDT